MMSDILVSNEDELIAFTATRIHFNDECNSDISKAEFQKLPYCTLDFKRKYSARLEEKESDAVYVIILPLAHITLAEKDCYLRVRVSSEIVQVHSLVITE